MKFTPENSEALDKQVQKALTSDFFWSFYFSQGDNETQRVIFHVLDAAQTQLWPKAALARRESVWSSAADNIARAKLPAGHSTPNYLNTKRVGSDYREYWKNF